ncbi:M48 family metallopeptidase [Nocardioides speluncae]|uniref:M48 family metallopeptidase n=1 Tax=Nocardioides speluncae TaxID=2670337 RepID=UPI000D699384|nr:M48 family metallopeptidase [Nocardioides speluncae]
MSTPDRATALIVTLLGGGAFVVLAALLVPWGPIPGGAVTAAPVGDVLSPKQVASAEDYAGGTLQIGLASLAVSLAVSLLLGLTPLGSRLMKRLPGWWWVQVVLGTAAVLLIGRVATLPFSLVQRERRLDVGLTHQALSAYAVDQAKSLALSVVVVSLALMALVACARRFERRWPAVAGGVLAALVMAGSFAYPVLVEPLFNNFEALPDGSLRTQVLELAEEEGVPVDDVLVADASRRTTTLNAYVSGYGGTRRVVLYDNLVDDLPEDQALSVVAHELAHARHDDVLAGSLLGASGTLLAVGLLGLVTGASVVRRRTGTEGLAVVTAVPLVLALSALATFAAAPVENGISRQIETRADVDALRFTNDPGAFIAMQKRLAVRSLADPTPPGWSHWWFGSHPTTLERVAIARRMGER